MKSSKAVCLKAILASAVAVVALLGSASAASAQLAAYQPIGVLNGPAAPTYASASLEEQVVFNTPKVVTNTLTQQSTQIIGRLNGGAPLFDQTYADTFSSQVVQTGVTSARAAITSAGGPGVVIGTPVRTASSTSTTVNSVTTYSLAQTDLLGAATTYIGPVTGVQIGPRSACTGIAALPSNTRPSCAPVAPTAQYLTAGPSRVINYTGPATGALSTDRIDQTPVLVNVAAGATLTDITLTNVYTIDQTTTTTNTTTNFEQYTITGTVQPVGGTNDLCKKAGYSAASSFFKKLSYGKSSAPKTNKNRFDLNAGRLYVWGETYSLDDTRLGLTQQSQSMGNAGGFSVQASDDLRFGFAYDDGLTNLSLASQSEAAGLRLRQIGGFVAKTNGAYVTTIAALHGEGTADSLRALPFVGASSGSFGVRTDAALIETKRPTEAFGWAFAPSAGIEYVRYHADAYSEVGGLALKADAVDQSRTRLLIGAEASRDFATPIGALSLNVSAKASNILAGRGGDQIVRFAALPDLPLTLRSAKADALGADLSAGLSLQLTDRAALSVAYDGSYQGDVSDSAANMTLSLRW